MCLRYGKGILASRTLDLMTRPQLVTRDMLSALGTGEFQVCHKIVIEDRARRPNW
jgi:hypothetical protein